MQNNATALRFGNKVFRIHPDFSLVREIEHELGGIVAIHERLTERAWKISEVVTLTQMMLQSAGETVDYQQLGNAMLAEGLDRYHASACAFLQALLHSGVSPDAFKF